MAFGRRKRDEPDVSGTAASDTELVDPETSDAEFGHFEDDLDPEDRKLEDAELSALLDKEEMVARRAVQIRPQGPWDAADAPERETPLLELGALHVPVPPETEVRVDVSPEGEVVAATLVQGESSLQVNVFAAPRSEGIWAEVRAEIRDALNGSGGQAEEVEGRYGTELTAVVPTEVAGQGVVMAPARFLGVDGPRWFLRGLVTGPAATDEALAAPLLDAMREIVVVRGNDPMAVRDPLPLVLPVEATQQDTSEPAEATPDEPNLQLPERGPEITEIR